LLEGLCVGSSYQPCDVRFCQRPLHQMFTSNAADSESNPAPRSSINK
jgi:hypothetical protein